MDPEEGAEEVAVPEQGSEAAAGGTKPKNKKYRRDKPWDHEGIDHWKVRTVSRVSASSSLFLCDSFWFKML